MLIPSCKSGDVFQEMFVRFNMLRKVLLNSLTLGIQIFFFLLDFDEGVKSEG